MKSLTKEKPYDMIDAFNSTSSYLCIILLLNIDNIHFEQTVHRIYFILSSEINAYQKQIKMISFTSGMMIDIRLYFHIFCIFSNSFFSGWRIACSLWSVTSSNCYGVTCLTL